MVNPPFVLVTKSAAMFFIPNITRKRGGRVKWLVKPFPINLDKKCKGVFTGISVEVFLDEDIVTLYDNGFYGKGSQSRSSPHTLQKANISKAIINEVHESLSLGLEEAFFLAYYLKVLDVKDLAENQLDHRTFLQHCLTTNAFFVETLASYLYLKSRGWVVKSGLKFGGNFLIYRKGPRFFHASFVVLVVIPSEVEHLRSKNLKGLQRIAETSDKDVLVLEVHKPDNLHFSSVNNISDLEISEMIIRRFNCTSYVQNQNITK